MTASRYNVLRAATGQNPWEEADPSCGCQPNAAGDIPCHYCGQYVNRRCWNCQTPRGKGPCPSSK